MVRTLCSHAEVRSLVGKLISHKPHGVAKILKKNRAEELMTREAAWDESKPQASSGICKTPP